MKEQLAALYALQLIDTQVAGLERALASLDDGTAQAGEVAALERRSAEANVAARRADADLRDGELSLKQVEEKVASERTRLYSGSVRNPKELRGIEHEIESLQRTRGDLDERVLVAMEARETAHAGRDDSAGALASARTKLEEIRAHFAGRNAELTGELAKVRPQRDDMAGSIPPILLRTYEAIRRRGHNLAVVRVTEPSCPGCHMALPSLVLKRLDAPTELITCESCGRILYKSDA